MTELRKTRVDGIGSEVNNGIDKSTQSLITTPNGLNQISDGNSYFVKGFTSGLATSGNSINFAMTTPSSDEWVHLSFNIDTTNLLEVKEFEGATVSGGGTVTPFNSNRNSTNASSVTLLANAVISGGTPTSGTLLALQRIGVAGATPAKVSVAGAAGWREIILKSGTTYLWEFKTGAADNVINWNAVWYEYTDKVQQF